MSMHSDNHNLDLPPGFRCIGLREHRDAFVHACGVAAEEGAGTLVWVRRFDSVEAAVVLEPEQSLAEARCALYAGMNAIADALATYCPPERPLEFAWPDTILLDGGVIGGCRLGIAPGTAAGDVPDWMVLGLDIRSIVPATLDHGYQRGTSLEAEGFEMMDGARILESFTRHLMAGFDGWRADGVKAVFDRYLARLQKQSGIRHGLDVDGDLLVRRLTAPTAVERVALGPMLAHPQWLDPATGEPWM